jgi:hypothetical protein
LTGDMGGTVTMAAWLLKRAAFRPFAEPAWHTALAQGMPLPWLAQATARPPRSRC